MIYGRATAKRRAMLAIFAVVVFTFGFPCLYFNWHYFPFVYSGYDSSFNAERVRQPIIEDYFVPKFENAKRRQIWYAPDTLKFEKMHTGKLYATEYGEIVFESDSYRKNTDSGWFRLSREYYYRKDSVAYYLEFWLENNKTYTDTLTKIQGDSMLVLWKEHMN